MMGQEDRIQDIHNGRIVRHSVPVKRAAVRHGGLERDSSERREKRGGDEGILSERESEGRECIRRGSLIDLV